MAAKIGDKLRAASREARAFVAGGEKTIPRAKGIVAAKSSQRNSVANNKAPKPGKNPKP